MTKEMQEKIEAAKAAKRIPPMSQEDWDDFRKCWWATRPKRPRKTPNEIPGRKNGYTLFSAQIDGVYFDGWVKDA